MDGQVEEFLLTLGSWIGQLEQISGISLPVAFVSWFTVWCETCFPYSQTGKKLMAKCRMLIQENQELGRQLSQGRIAQLEAELALQKKYSEELKTSQDGENMSGIHISQPDYFYFTVCECFQK